MNAIAPVTIGLVAAPIPLTATYDHGNARLK
jgi:hypothetical protein